MSTKEMIYHVNRYSGTVKIVKDYEMID
jgi:hypothetical protein